MATLRSADSRQGREGLPHLQEDHVAGAQRRGRRRAARSAAGRQPRAHPLRRPRLQHRRPPSGTPSSSSTASKRNKHQLAHEDRVRHRQRRAASSRCSTSRSTDETRPRTTMAELDVVQEAVRVLPEADGAATSSPTLLDQLMDVDHRGHQRRQGLPDPDGVGRAGASRSRATCARETISDAVSQLSDSIIAKVVETPQAAHHLGRAARRRVQELAVGDEPEADLGDVRAAARARATCSASSTSATTTSRTCSSETHLEVLTIFAAQASLHRAERAAGQRAASSTTSRCTSGSSRSASARSSARRRAMQEVFRKVAEGRGDRHLAC